MHWGWHRKYDPDQPRASAGSADGGQWIASGASPFATASSHYAGYAVHPDFEAFTKLEVKERASFDKTKLNEMADAVNSIPAAVAYVQGSAGQWQRTNDVIADVHNRVEAYARSGTMTADSAAGLHSAAIDLHRDLSAVGIPADARRAVIESVVDHIAAQEYESMGRTLGDHGVRHLINDRDTAIQVLGALPNGQDTAYNRVMITLAAAYHDTGYMTPPGRTFGDSLHPLWSQQYYDAKLKGLASTVLGQQGADALSKIIREHDGIQVDWQNDPVGSAFRLADNLSLFHQEKFPALVRYAPKNIGVLADYAAGKLTLAQTKDAMRANIVESKALSSSSRERVLKAVDEVSPILPKFTLGMLSGRLDHVAWQGGGLGVAIRRTPNDVEKASLLRRIGADLGLRQFKKLAEAYGYKSDEDIARAFRERQVVFESRQGGRIVFNFEGGRLVKFELVL